MRSYLLSLSIAIVALLGLTTIVQASELDYACPTSESFYYNNQCGASSCPHASGSCAANRRCMVCAPWTGNEALSWGFESAEWYGKFFAHATNWKFQAYAPWTLKWPTSNATYWKGDPSSGYTLGNVDQYMDYGWVTLVYFNDTQPWIYETAEMPDWTGEAAHTTRIYADGVNFGYR